jgi:hypothetical protein
MVWNSLLEVSSVERRRSSTQPDFLKLSVARRLCRRFASK